MMMPVNYKTVEPEAAQQLPSYCHWNFIQDDGFLFEDYSENEEKEPQSVPEGPFLGQPNNTDAGLSAVPNWMSENMNYKYDATTNFMEQLCSPAPSVSPAPSSVATTFSYSTNVEEESMPNSSVDLAMALDALGVDEAELEELSVKDLNRLLKSKGLTKEQQHAIKYRRRTLKNRGYAQNCRIKRITQKKSLENTNWDLVEQVNKLSADLEVVKRERDYYKKKFDNLLAFVMKSAKKRS